MGDVRRAGCDPHLAGNQRLFLRPVGPEFLEILRHAARRGATLVDRPGLRRDRLIVLPLHGLEVRQRIERVRIVGSDVDDNAFGAGEMEEGDAIAENARNAVESSRLSELIDYATFPAFATGLAVAGTSAARAESKAGICFTPMTLRN